MLTDEREAMSESKFNFSHFHGIEYNLYFFYKPNTTCNYFPKNEEKLGTFFLNSKLA